MQLFDINSYWDGTPCADPLLQGTIAIEATKAGVRITATLPHQPTPNIPEADPLSRVANLWEYDVVECFLVGEEKYLEVELGAGGHFLVLDFTAPRVRAEEYEDFLPDMHYKGDAGDGRWSSSVLVPWEMVPKGIKAINAFVIVGENYVCHSALPGPVPDFHQPDRFPAIADFARS